jgi:RecQ family ATP-dependent DNA helicase
MNGFRNNQEEIIKYIMQGNDALVFMPTGGGKSLCYQLPAVCCEGVSLVVSPLLALIQNQVDSLKTLNINCNSLNSSQNLATKRMILKDLESAEPKIKLLYVTPELLATDSFRLIAEKLFKKNRLSRLIVDEAHCISEWGHDFRESYRKLSWFKEKFPV